MHTRMTAEETYIQSCESSKVEPQKEVITALNAISSTGELDLQSTNLNAWTWQIIGRIVASCKDIQKLNVSNCLIPPRGLAALLAALSQGTEIHTLDLRGNNIQTTNVTHLGRMLRHNISLKSLSLEWNSLGIFPETFVMFCDGLAVNQTLQILDLRNNQLSSECATSLTNALTRNNTLKSLDLRWNNLGWKGGQLLHSLFNSNQSLTTLKLQGNCIPMELTLAIEQAAAHNATRVSILQECAARTDLLARQLRKAEEERSRELHGLTKQSEEKLRDILRTSEARITQMEKTVSEKELTLKNAQERLHLLDHELKDSLQRNEQMVHQLKDRDRAYQELLQSSQKEVEELNKILVAKDEHLTSTMTELKGKLTAEQKRRIALETANLNQAEEITQLETEVEQLKDKINRTRKLHEETLLKEQEASREIITGMEKECEARINKIQSEANIQRSSLRLQIQELEKAFDDHERTKSELMTGLARERARREEEVALANQEAKNRESGKVAQLEEKLNTLREEKTSLEKQLTIAHSSVLQLQQQNNALILEMAEPQRKLSQLHEELSNERLASQRMRQELAEEGLRLQGKKKECERLQTDINKLQEKVNELEKWKMESKRDHEQERGRLLMLMEQRDREIQSIREDEMERAGILYSAFNKYLGGLSPSKSKLNANM